MNQAMQNIFRRFVTDEDLIHVGVFILEHKF
jgi:hypothetical protein